MERDLKVERTASDQAWPDAGRRQLEDAADRLLAEVKDGTPLYSGRALARKIRLEDARLPEVEETAIPTVAVDYLLHSQVRLLAHYAQLTRLQAAVLFLAVEGMGPAQIADRFGMSYRAVQRQLRIARWRVSSMPSPYAGLYEVYWSEVHRYIYRKPKAGV